MDLLRLAGAPGVGKSTVAWAIAQRAAADGVAVGFVDIDQLGMCYPAPEGDPDRWALKERALAGVALQFRAAGVARLVVSGVARPEERPPQIDGMPVLPFWLDASEATRRERLRSRGLREEQLAQALAAGSSEAMRVDAAWERIDTETRSVPEVVGEVLRGTPRMTDPTRDRAPIPPRQERGRRPDRALWVTGPRLAGASRVGWEIASEEWRRGRRVGFADVTQLSFAWNTEDPVGLSALTSLHETFRDADAERLVVVAPFEIGPATARSALPASDLSFVRLTATRDGRRAHAHHRQSGSGPDLAGDDVKNASDAAIAQLIEAGDRQSSIPLRDGESSVETLGLSPEESAAAVRRCARW